MLCPKKNWKALVFKQNLQKLLCHLDLGQACQKLISCQNKIRVVQNLMRPYFKTKIWYSGWFSFLFFDGELFSSHSCKNSQWKGGNHHAVPKVKVTAMSHIQNQYQYLNSACKQAVRLLWKIKKQILWVKVTISQHLQMKLPTTYSTQPPPKLNTQSNTLLSN